MPFGLEKLFGGGSDNSTRVEPASSSADNSARIKQINTQLKSLREGLKRAKSGTEFNAETAIDQDNKSRTAPNQFQSDQRKAESKFFAIATGTTASAAEKLELQIASLEQELATLS